jgi:hypothetical protein
MAGRRGDTRTQTIVSQLVRILTASYATGGLSIQFAIE